MKLRVAVLFSCFPWIALAAESAAEASESAAGSPGNLAALVKFEIPTFEFIKLDQKPVIKLGAPPQYPSGMRQAQIEGEVLVDFVVNSEGKVVKAFAVRSSHRDFEAAAVAAVSKWKFSPGTKGGGPVNTHMQVPIGFSLN